MSIALFFFPLTGTLHLTGLIKKYMLIIHSSNTYYIPSTCPTLQQWFDLPIEIKHDPCQKPTV